MYSTGILLTLGFKMINRTLPSTGLFSFPWLKKPETKSLHVRVYIKQNACQCLSCFINSWLINEGFGCWNNFQKSLHPSLPGVCVVGVQITVVAEEIWKSAEAVKYDSLHLVPTQWLLLGKRNTSRPWLLFPTIPSAKEACNRFEWSLWHIQTDLYWCHLYQWWVDCWQRWDLNSTHNLPSEVPPS